MYSGLVSEIGTVQAAQQTEEGLLLTVRAPGVAARVRRLGSVAVAGTCLTVLQAADGCFSVLAGAETEARSTLAALTPGSPVNLETPLSAGDPLDGHLVQGHVEGVAVVTALRQVGGVLYAWFRPNKRLIEGIVPKGSVAVDGVSLTAVEVNRGTFSVALIPETLRASTLGRLQVGDRVNVETDILGKYIQRTARRPVLRSPWAGLVRGREAVEAAIATIAAGGKVVVWDPAREGEGDVIIAGDTLTAADVNFCMTHVRGLMCTPMAQELLDRLAIARMPGGGDHHGTAFMVTVDAAEGVTTGIPASERARTIRLLASPAAAPASFVRPGHVFPLAAHAGGLLSRQGHTEAAVALTGWAGRPQVAVCCEIAAPDGEMAKLPDLELFAAEHGLPIVAIEDLVEYARSR